MSLPDAAHTLIADDWSVLPLPTSHDDGATWSAGFEPNDAVTAFLASRTHPGTVWMGTLRGDIWTSTDGGRTATGPGHVPGGPWLSALGRRGSMFVALEGSGHLARSTDLTHWTVSAFADGSYDATVTEDGVAYAVDYAARTMLRSTDGGATITTADLGAALFPCPTFAFGSGRTAAAGVVMVDDCGNVWRSANGGVKFSLISKMPQNDPRSVAIDASDPATIYVSSLRGTAVSHDAGITWSDLPNAPANAILEADATRGGVVDVLTDSVLKATYDGGATWREIGPHLTAPGFVRSVARTATAMLAGTTDGVKVRPNGASTWHDATGLGRVPGEVTKLLVDPLRPDVVFSSGLFRSTDGGETWARPGTPIVAADFALDPSAIGSIWAASDTMLAHSTDDGATWKHLPLDALRLAVVHGQPQTILLARSDGGVWRSTDGGETASIVLPAKLPFRGSWYAGPQVFASPYTPGLVLAQTPTYEYRSTDGGLTWSPLLVQLRLDLPPQFLPGGTILAIDVIGDVLASPDGGVTWTTTPDPTDPSGVLTSLRGIAILVPPLPSPLAVARADRPVALAAVPVASSVPRVLTVRRGVRSRLFRGVLARLRYYDRPVAGASTAVIRVRVVCMEPRTRYCGGSVTVRQNGEIVGQTPFTVPPSRHRHTYTVRVVLVGAIRGAATVELRATLPWRSALRASTTVRL